MSIPTTQKILYVSDLGENTRPVFRQAIAQARVHGASISMLHVVEPISDAAQMAIGTYFPNDIAKEMQKDGMRKVLSKMRERVQKFVEDECSGGLCELTPVQDIFVVMGKPCEEILRVAEEQEVDLIVMGKSAKKIKGIRTFGGTSRRVTKYSRVPVLVVPNSSNPTP